MQWSWSWRLRMATTSLSVIIAVSVLLVLKPYVPIFENRIVALLVIAPSVLPLVIWEVFLPRSIDLTVGETSTRHELANWEIALQFRDSNPMSFLDED